MKAMLKTAEQVPTSCRGVLQEMLQETLHCPCFHGLSIAIVKSSSVAAKLWKTVTFSHCSTRHVALPEAKTKHTVLTLKVVFDNGFKDGKSGSTIVGLNFVFKAA